MPRTLLILSILATALTLQYGCRYGNANDKIKNSKEFEGVIAYHEIIKNRDSSFNVDDTVLLMYSHGNYVGAHSSLSQNYHLVRDYYLQSKPLRLLQFVGSDTLYQLNLNFPIEKLESFRVKHITDKVLSRKCEMIELNTSYPDKGSTTYTDFRVVFSRGYLNVERQYFKNWNLGFFNKIIDESETFYLKFKAVHFDGSHKNILSSKTYDVISVKEQPVDPSVFQIDTSKIKRQQ